MDVAAMRNPHSNFLQRVDDVAIMDFPHPSINQQHRRNTTHYTHEWFPHQPVHHQRQEWIPRRQPVPHRRQEPVPRNTFSPFFTITSSEDGDTSFLIQNRNHHHIHFIENTPYEQLLQLQERIGNVSTGLSEEKITACLKTRTVTSGDGNDDEKIFNETCIVCQDEYKDHDTIATLKCGHEYHRDCIKEWLLLKNVCPVCKRPAQ